MRDKTLNNHEFSPGRVASYLTKITEWLISLVEETFSL
ncbi:hypothetical protein CLERM_691 [Coxiella-like endosymbiont]|nr:hypothetical protein CLERM_740 [Coxiella-like endosymbiont]PMB55036.1 hypothetical protein CLERM_691 [Coxiella-like endosymbiont]